MRDHRKSVGMMFVLASCSWAVFASSGAAVQAPASAPKGKLQSLFNGKDLAGWKIMRKGQFSVRGGLIFLNRGGGWLRTEKAWQDFELRMVFRFVDKNSNSGIFFRADNHPGPNVGYQVQTKDDLSICSIYNRGLGKPRVQKDEVLLKKTLKPAGQWQEYRIRAQGGRVEVSLNGKRITVAEGLTVRKGHVGIQGEGGTLEFRTVEITEL